MVRVTHLGYSTLNDIIYNVDVHSSKKSMASQYTLFPPLVPAVPVSPITAIPRTSTIVSVTTIDTLNDRRILWNAEGGWSIALIILTTIRLVITLCLWTYLTYGTIRARTRLALVWPHQMLLAVVTASHGVLYIFALVATRVVCGIIRLCLGPIFVTLFGVLLLKLIIIAANDKGYDVPRAGQILILLLVIGVQLGLSVQWVLLLPSSVFKGHPSTCDISASEWLGHLSYVGIVLVAATVLALIVHEVKTDRRESMFLGLAVGLNVPLLAAFSFAIGLQSSSDGDDVEKLLAFALLSSSTVVLIVMFLPRSRQLSAMGESGLYSEDVTVDVKPISELTVHKLYYPVYEEQIQHRPSPGSSVTTTVRSGQRNDFAFCERSDSPANELNTGSALQRTIQSKPSSHWYPPLNNNACFPSRLDEDRSSIHFNGRHHQLNKYSSQGLNHLDQSVGIRRVRIGVHGDQSVGFGINRCLTPPSEEGSTTPSATRGDSDVEGEEEEDEVRSEVDIADFNDNNINGVSYTSVHVNSRQPEIFSY